MNVFEEVTRLCDQWERQSGPLPPDARHQLCQLVRRIVLKAARCCARRAEPEDKSMSTRNEARKCASAVRHYLLCKEGESVCLHCDGEGCPYCHMKGVRR